MIACATVRVSRRTPCATRSAIQCRPCRPDTFRTTRDPRHVFQNRLLQRIGGWNGHLPRWNDWELGLRALLHNPRVVWLKDKPYHSVYEHAESITGTDFSSSARGIAYRLADSSLRGWHPKPMLVCVGLPQLYIGRQFCPRKQHRKRKSGKTARQCHAEQTVWPVETHFWAHTLSLRKARRTRRLAYSTPCSPTDQFTVILGRQ